MKILFKNFIFLSLLFYSSLLYAETGIAFLDMDIIYNKSSAGTSIFKELEKINNKNISKFKKNEDLLKKEEQQIAAQKNILSKEEFEKKVLFFKEKVNKYQTERNKTINELKKKRMKAIKDLSLSVNKILAEYSDEKKISIIVPKKNIIIGKNELDITKDILTLVDKKIKKINLN